MQHKTKNPAESIENVSAVLKAYKALPTMQEGRKDAEYIRELLRDLIHYSCKSGLDIHPLYGHALADYVADLHIDAAKKDASMTA